MVVYCTWVWVWCKCMYENHMYSMFMKYEQVKGVCFWRVCSTARNVTPQVRMFVCLEYTQWFNWTEFRVCLMCLIVCGFLSFIFSLYIRVCVCLCAWGNLQMTCNWAGVAAIAPTITNKWRSIDTEVLYKLIVCLFRNSIRL